MLTIANPAVVLFTIPSARCDRRRKQKAASTTRLFSQVTGASVRIESQPKLRILVLTRFLDANRNPPRIKSGAGFRSKTLYRHSTLVLSEALPPPAALTSTVRPFFFP